MGGSIKGVLFDLDGTLVDSHDLILASFRYATREVLGREIPDEALMAKVGQPLAVQMWDFTDDAAVHDELLRVYRDHNDDARARHTAHRAAEAQAPPHRRMCAEAGSPSGSCCSHRRCHPL